MIAEKESNDFMENTKKNSLLNPEMISQKKIFL